METLPIVDLLVIVVYLVGLLLTRLRNKAPIATADQPAILKSNGLLSKEVLSGIVRNK